MPTQAVIDRAFRAALLAAMSPKKRLKVMRLTARYLRSPPTAAASNPSDPTLTRNAIADWQRERMHLISR